jgi:peroxiredoxin
MAPLQPGSGAPSVPGVSYAEGPRVLYFFKVTCPVCQLAAPKIQVLERAYPGRVTGVGQDPEDELARFAREYGTSFRWVADLPPYEVSEAFGIEVVPTTFLVSGDGRVLETVESWDREGLNRLSRHLASLLGVEPVPVSTPEDGLPDFQPG